MKKMGIPDHVKMKVEGMIKVFNEKYFNGSTSFYLARFKGKFLYLDRSDYGKIGPIFRLKYQGSINNWECAIFKWSSERYDPDEWMFPGSANVDGTIDGAMKAGIEAYPI